MKLVIANALSALLSGIKINKITDKKTKSILLSDFLNLRKAVKDAEAERQEIIDKFQKDWSDELSEVAKCRADKTPVEGHDEFLEAEKDANSLIAEIFNKDVEVKIEPIALEKFTSYCESEDITFEQIAFLQDFGIIN